MSEAWSLRRFLLVMGVCLVSVGAGYGLHHLLFGVAPAPPEASEDLGDRQLVESRSSQADVLAALGYVEGTVDGNAAARDVLRHDQQKAHQGINFYYSRTDSEAQLVDMEGETIYRWAYEADEPWQHAELNPEDGSLLVMIKDVGLMKLDKDSQLQWSHEARVHHDLWVDGQGQIHMLARHSRPMPEIHPTIPVLDDVVQRISAEGELIEEWSVLQMLRDSPYAFLLPEVSQLKPRKKGAKETDLDLLHTNHIEVFDGHLASLDPMFAQGNLLISMRNINAVVIADGTTRELLWIWGPSNLSFQHHPVLLDSGKLLIFDNGTKRSRVIELDPRTREIVWRYSDGKEFYSRTRGANQRLANGNTLITESDTGYVFEVTPAGETVWEFANPDVDQEGVRSAIWRMTRHDRAALTFLP